MAGQTIINLGTGGSILNGQSGSTPNADSNDPKELAWPGDNGGNYIYTPGVASNYLSVPDAAALDITGDIDIRVQVAMDDWTPAASMRLISKAATGQWSYEFSLLSAGTLNLNWSADGSATISKTSTAATAVADGAAKWVRVTLDVDNGASGNDVKFWLSDDGVSWTQLGSTVTTAGVTSVFAGTASLGVGQRPDGNGPTAASVYRAIIKNGIDGSTVLDIDTSVLTSGSQTSFTAWTGQTVTINRSTSGRKTVAVTQPCWLFGTDDYLEVADHPLLDFGASESFTVLVVIRQWATPTSFGRYISKRATTGAGWHIISNGTTTQGSFSGTDGSNAYSTVGSVFTAGSVVVLGGVVVRTAQTASSITNSTVSATASTTAVGSLTNTLPVRVGRVADTGIGYQDFELLAVAVFRRVLSSAELAQLSTYYASRWP